MSKILYFTCWYAEPYPTRRLELERCLLKTLESEDIDQVILFVEPTVTVAPIKTDKLKLIHMNSRPKYTEMFELANQHAEIGDVIVLANTDIFPDAGVRPLLQSIKPNECYALSRWDVQEDESSIHFNRRDSQDVWCFRAKMITIRGGDFTMGRAGCDNRIAFDIMQSGYIVTNPSRTIKFHHLHLTNIRHYNPSNTIKSPYHLIEPSFLNSMRANTQTINP